MKRSERGAALLTVLLLVSVMAVLSASALERLRTATRLAANAGAIDQARAFAFAAEEIARARITTLAEADPARTPVTGWQDRETSLPLPGGTAVAVVRDGGNCFNLNSVASGEPGRPLLTRPAGAGQFAALMQSLGIDAAAAQKTAASLADWIDSDQAEQPGGAEDAAYAGLDAPYRTAGALVADPSELRAVAGVTPELYERVRPWVCALPVTDLSPLNVNTLSPERAPLIAMLLPGKLTPEAARAVLQRRPPNGWDSAYAFGQVLAAQGVVLGPGEAQLGVKTRWFGLELKVRLGDAEVDETALIDAGTLPARLIRRSWGEGL